MAQSQLSFQTQLIHGAARPDTSTLALATPIYASTAFQIIPDDQRIPGAPLYIYSRMGNPTVAAFENRVALLEGGAGAVAVSTGQAATMLAVLCLGRAGDNFVVSSKQFGGSFQQWTVMFARLGIEARFVKTQEPGEWEAAIDEKTKGFFFESIANPSLEVFDIALLAEVAHKHGVPVLVDSTIGAGGYLIKPFEHGADIVIHSATKWIAGNGTTLGGVVVSSGKFSYKGNPRFPEFNEELPGFPGLVVTDPPAPGMDPLCLKLRHQTLRDFGCALSPFAARDLLLGLETMALRVARQCESALALAAWLEQHPDVAWVAYPGLPSHPSHALAQRYFPRGAGGIVTFALRPSAHGLSPVEHASRFAHGLKLALFAANLGDSRTLVVPPWATTQMQLSEQQKRDNGTLIDAIRVSVGLEDVEDIKQDFEQAIAAAMAATPAVVV